MKKQAMNPYMPLWEYVPDGEPHVFGDRLYVFGSHDRFNGDNFCMNDYVCWSAPADDLSDWKYEGVIYRKTQAYGNEDGKYNMQAPDVARGSDGRYYLFYALMFATEVQVAVSERPEGPYEYYGKIHYSSGKVFGKKYTDPTPFDPAVFADDDGRVWLYVGNSMDIRPLWKVGKLLRNKKMRALGGWVVELEKDMLTVKGAVKQTVPGPEISEHTEFADCPFFEASSMRKIDGKYYFVYSSMNSHDLCCAVSDRPDGPFSFGGRLLSNGNVGYNGNKKAEFYWGNNHGSLIEIRGTYYIFGHRQTNANEFSRQAIAEKITLSNGGFLQAEYTSCGLNGGPLSEHGIYSAGIACVLYDRDGACKVTELKDRRDSVPYITQSGEDRESDPEMYITNIVDGTTAGFKYFRMETVNGIRLWTRGSGTGSFEVRYEKSGKAAGRVPVSGSETWQISEAEIAIPVGVNALYLIYSGEGTAELLQFELFTQG